MKHPVIVASDSNHPTPVEWTSVCVQLATHPDQPNDFGKLWGHMAVGMRTAQVFDFGVIFDQILAKESKRGGKLWGMGHLDVPYRSAIYRYKAIPDPVVLEEHFSEYDDPEFRERASKASEYCTLFTKSDDGYLFAADFIRVNELRDKHKTAFALSAACIGKPNPEDIDRWIGMPVSSDFCLLDSASKSHAMGAVMDGVIGLSMMLSTRNIKLRVEEVSQKLNKKRASSGKPPLPTVTHVNASHYFEAMRNSAQKGTHASPVPHLRRGHMRNYENGRTIWIKDTIVNARSISEIQRDHYEVRV